MKILVVDDDPRLRDLLRVALERAGFAVLTAGDGQSALVRAARDRPDLVVLDIGLPELDGLEVCRRIRARSDLPVLFLTARDDEIDRVLGLELGADDYVTKPFSPREVVARVRAILRRGAGRRVQERRIGALVLDAAARTCRAGGQDLPLTATEYRLMACLAQEPGHLIPRAALLQAVWGAQSAVSDRTLDSHLRNLRQKLTDAGLSDLIETRHGQGFRLRLPE